jgi:NAD(P)-dependent dehydrogenase (short-subunit alcohol dehydrogenase family)
VGGRNTETVRELSARGIEAVELDVTSDASVEEAAQHILRNVDRIDVLVNNAGSAYWGVVEAFTPQLVREQYEVNVFGPLRVNRAFLPKMRERRSGLVVYVSSIVGRFTAPFIGVYASSKYALEALAETSAYELKPFGIDVSIVQPGAYVTNIGNRRVLADDEARTASYGDVADTFGQIITGLGESASERPEEVAEAILGLARREAGRRPLRLVIGGNEAAAAINGASASVSRAVLQGFGFEEFAPAVPVEEPSPA